MSEDTELPTGSDGQVATDPIWSPLRCEKLVTFAGATSNAWGDKDGSLAAGAIFTVTGTVRVRIVAVCETLLTGAGKLEVGVTGLTAGLIAQIASAESIDAGEVWFGADAPELITAITNAPEKIIPNGLDLILTQSTADITAGAIRFLVSWYPISKNGKVVPSGN